MDNEPFQEHANNLLTDVGLILIRVVCTEEAKDGEAEIVGVAIGVTKLIRHRTQQIITGLGPERLCELLQEC